MKRGIFAMPGVLCIVWIATLAVDAQDAKDAKKRKPGITIGRDTTYIDGPLDKDGYPDYEAALNERLREGVTPENNANVLLWQTVGPRSDIQEPARFFKALGIPELPKD